MMVPWLSISTKSSVVTWNFMNVSSSRREGVMKEGVVEKPPAQRERDNVVYWETNGKINNDLQQCRPPI
jgi:hypothetical protein